MSNTATAIEAKPRTRARGPTRLPPTRETEAATCPGRAASSPGTPGGPAGARGAEAEANAGGPN
eukprot:612849-Lingulodinium_polyedra.AAC.1